MNEAEAVRRQAVEATRVWQRVASEEGSRSDALSDAPTAAETDFAPVVEDYFTGLVDAVSRSVASVSIDHVNRLVTECADILDAGGKIVVSGLGKNVPICDKFVGSMRSLGENAAFMDTAGAMHGDLGLVHDKDLVIVLTKSGETIESIRLLEHLRQRSVPVWGVTFNEESTLTRLIPNNIVLSLDHEGDPWNVMPNNSTTVSLIVLQALVMLLAHKRRKVIDDFKRNHPGGHIGVLLGQV